LRTSVKVVVITIPIVILAFLIFAYLLSQSYTSREETDEKIDEMVQNLQSNYYEDYREEINTNPSYKVMYEVLGEPRVQQKFKVLEAKAYGTEEEANSKLEAAQSYFETRAKTTFEQKYPLESFAGNLGNLIFGK
jgi:hypothetical protein